MPAGAGIQVGDVGFGAADATHRRAYDASKRVCAAESGAMP